MASIKGSKQLSKPGLFRCFPFQQQIQSHLQRGIGSLSSSNIPSRAAIACNGTAYLAGGKNAKKPITQVQKERWNKVRRKVVIAVERIFTFGASRKVFKRP